MPVYEYVCRNCGHEFEEWSPSMSAAGPDACPKCRGRKIERKISVFSAHQGERTSSAPVPGACGRCGDPAGPCSR